MRDDGGLEISRQLYALETRVLTLELHRAGDREDIEAIQAQRAEEKAAFVKLLIGALLAVGGLLFGVIRPKFGL